MYMYMYMYRERERERERLPPWARTPRAQQEPWEPKRAVLFRIVVTIYYWARAGARPPTGGSAGSQGGNIRLGDLSLSIYIVYIYTQL